MAVATCGASSPPACTRRSGATASPSSVVSVPLFLGGAALAYIFLPKGFDLLIGFNPDPDKVANIIGLNDYLSFVLRMFLVFGIAFVLPVFLVRPQPGRHRLPAASCCAPGARSSSARSSSPPIATPVRRPVDDDGAGRADAGPATTSPTSLSLLVDRRRRLQGIDGLDYSELDDDEASPLDTTASPLDPSPTRTSTPTRTGATTADRPTSLRP